MSQSTSEAVVVGRKIQADIQEQNFRQVYLLWGEEEYLKQFYKKKLIKAIQGEEDSMNINSFQGEAVEVETIIDLAQTVPFFSQRRLIVLENTGFFKKSMNELANYIKELPTYTHIIFVEKEVDKRGKLYKAVQTYDGAMPLNSLTEEEVRAWVVGNLKRENKKIQPQALSQFIKMTGNDLENMDNELEKLLAYTYGKDSISQEDVRSVCIAKLENRVFDMLDAVAHHQQKEAIIYYHEMLADREPPMMILFRINKTFKDMLAVKMLKTKGYSQKEMASQLKLHPYVVKKLEQQSRAYSFQGIINRMDSGVTVEQQIKSGQVQDYLAVEMLILQHTRGENTRE